MFDVSSLQYSSEAPTFSAILFTIICSLLLGILIAFTYDKTSRQVDRPDHFLQAMVLVTIVAATIIQAIGDSVARGLGMLGALSIIRFRTTVKNPRNIIFIFAAIATGIACGVLGFVIAIAGTLAFCATAFLLRFSSFHTEEKHLGVLRIDLDQQEEDQIQQVRAILDQYCLKYSLLRYQHYPQEKKAHLLFQEYQLSLGPHQQSGQLMQALRQLETAKVLSLVFQNQQLSEI